ncbi:c-type cytochrome, partial [Tranquillimonas alkanivorans]
MSEILTKSRARNVFYGGSLFFIAIFVGLTVHSHRYVVDQSTAGMELSEQVVTGKHVWERHSCINCHTLHGEGAYFAPELGNVMTRWGVRDDPEMAWQMLDGWMKAQPSRIEGRRQMPFFELT